MNWIVSFVFQSSSILDTMESKFDEISLTFVLQSTRNLGNETLLQRKQQYLYEIEVKWKFIGKK